MKRLLGIALLLLSTFSSVSAMDTRAAGRCVTLGLLLKAAQIKGYGMEPQYQGQAQRYEAKALAIMETASRTGYYPLLQQSMDEEKAYVIAHWEERDAMKMWTDAAWVACRQF